MNKDKRKKIVENLKPFKKRTDEKKKIYCVQHNVICDLVCKYYSQSFIYSLCSVFIIYSVIIQLIYNLCIIRYSFRNVQLLSRSFTFTKYFSFFLRLSSGLLRSIIKHTYIISTYFSFN